MMAMTMMGVILGALLMACLAWFLDQRRPSREQQMRTYERRQRFAAQQERLRMNMLALETLREMLRQQNRRRF